MKQTDPEKLGKLRDHKSRVVISLTLDHPSNGLQRIIKEMGIDLALQGIELALPPLILFQNDLFHQGIDLFIRALYRMPEMPDLQ